MGHDDISILPAEPSDLEPVVELTPLVFFGDLGRDFGFNNNRATAFYELGIEQRQSVRGCLEDSSAVSLKATRRDELVGFVTGSREGVLTNLAVHPTARRAGLGRRLVQQLCEEASVPITLEVDSDNLPALALYQACGFAVTQEQPGTRYIVDWWRGRCVERVTKVAMMRQRHAGAGESEGG